KTPPNRIGSRLGDLYAWMFGAERPEPKADDDTTATSADAADDSLPWWRRNKTGREEDPDEGTNSQDLTEILQPTNSAANTAYDQAVSCGDATDAATEVITDVQIVTDRLGEQGSPALLDDSGDTGEQPALPRLSGLGTDGPDEGGLHAPTTPYVLPSPNALS